MFYLIRFLQPPYWSVGEYACVPNSWIVRKAGRKVHVAYPNADVAKAERRAENMEGPGNDWNVIEAEVESQSYHFVNADIWTTMEKVNLSTDEDEMVIIEDKDSTDSANEEIENNNNTHTKTSIRNGWSIQTRGKLLPNPLAAFREQLITAEKTTSNCLKNPLANDKNNDDDGEKEVTTKKDVEESLSTQNDPRAQEIIGKTTMKEDVEKLSSFLTNVKKVIADMSSSSQHQLTKSNHLISVVSEDILRYGCSSTPVPETNGTNGNDQITQAIKPSTQTLLNPVKPSQLSQKIKENMLKINEDGQPHRKLPGIIPDRPAKVDCIQRSNNLKVTKNTPPNWTKSPNLPHPKPQQNIPPSPAHFDHLPRKGTNNVVSTLSTGLKAIGDEEPRQTVVKNASPTVKKVSNARNQSGQTFKQAQEEQSQQAYDVTIQRSSNVNKIIITNSKMERNAQRIPSSISKNAIGAEQNFLNQAKLLSAMYKHWEQQLPLASREPQNPCKENVFVKTTTARNQPNVSQNNTKSTVQNFSSIDRLPKASNQSLTSAGIQNDGRQVTHAHRSLAGESTAANGLNQRPGLRETRQSITALPNLQSNQPLTENMHEIQPPPVIKAYLLQDPHTKLLFLRPATEVGGDEQKLRVQSTTEKVPPAPQAVPSTNQSNQPFNPPYKNQYVDSHGAEHQNLRAQQIFKRRPNTMHVTSQKRYPHSIQDIPLTVNPSNSVTRPACSCTCSQGRPQSSVTPKHLIAKPDPRLEVPFISESTAGNIGRQKVYPESDTDNRSAKENPTSLTTSEQRSTQENNISIQQSSCPQSNTGNKPIAQCSTDLANQPVEFLMAERNSAVYVDSSDNAMLTESSLKTIATTTATKDRLSALNDCKLLLSLMSSSISRTLEACKDMRSTVTEYNKSFKNVMGKVSDLCKLKIDQIHSIRSKKVENPRNKLKRRKDKNNDNSEECNQPSNKKRRQVKVQEEANSFVLPPEYNPDNSRWTLKHQKASPRLVEVIPRGRVYVDAINFKHCKRTAKDSKTLARMLLTEIFSENALRVCSLTGARAKAYGVRKVRPGLDEQARIILFTFVEDFGRKNGWVVHDTQSLLNSVRSKIQEIRNKAN